MNTIYPISHISTNTMLDGFGLQIKQNDNILDLAGGLSSLYTKGKTYISVDPVYTQPSYLLTKSVQQQIAHLLLVHWYDFPDYIKENAKKKLDELSHIYAQHPLIQQPSKEDIQLKIKKLQESSGRIQHAITSENKFAIAKTFLYGESNTLWDKEIIYKTSLLVDILLSVGVLSGDTKNKIITLGDIYDMSADIVQEKISQFQKEQKLFYHKVQASQAQMPIKSTKDIVFLSHKIESIQTDELLKKSDYIFCNFLFNNLDTKDCINILQSLEKSINDRTIYIATSNIEQDYFSQLIIDDGARENNGMLYWTASKSNIETVKKRLIFLRKRTPVKNLRETLKNPF